MARKKFRLHKPDETDAQREDLIGPVKKVKQITYKALPHQGIAVPDKIVNDYTHRRKNFTEFFDKKGTRILEHLYGKNERITNTYNGNILPASSVRYDSKGVLKVTTIHKCENKTRHVETISTNADGTLHYRIVNTFTEDGKPLEHIHTHGKDAAVLTRTIHAYDDKGNHLSGISYKADGSIHVSYTYAYDENGNCIETKIDYTDPILKKKLDSRKTAKYNEHGDCIETISYDCDGAVKSSYNYTYQYDSEGKKIEPPPREYVDDEDEESKNETEELVNDSYGNWIKKTVFHKKSPVNIIVREITYYGEEDDSSPDKEEEITPDDIDASAADHPLLQAESVEDQSNLVDKLPEDKANWLVDTPSVTAEIFPALRYYTMRFNEFPSVINYPGPHIEAEVLLRELKEIYKAQEIYSFVTYWNNSDERLSRYALIFPGQFGYMLQATSINSQNAYEFDIPDSMELDYDDYVHFSPFQLLRPGEASGLRDWYFENCLYELIEKCSLDKKPDKPVINIIEVRGAHFEVVEHAVNDNFEIKNLDLNYGYGFEKFHNDLMQRFYTSTKGLVLFHGLPGTGKTYYIRHLLRSMAMGRKIVIYLPPNMVDHLVDPSFMTFLSEKVKEWSQEGNFCVLLIEDAEPLLAKRQQGVRIQGVTNLLNMTDGLLNDMLNLQIICTFNVDLRKLDSALLRPGRLIARKEFKPLTELDANLLAQRLGIKHHFTAPATLGEIYSLQKDSNTLIHDVTPDRDASSSIDDLI